MTLNLWYESLAPPPPVTSGLILKAHGNQGWLSWPGGTVTITIPSYTTQLGDCIIVSGVTNTVSFYVAGSGAGATWVQFNGEVSFQPMNSLSVGYNTAAGQTTFTLTGPQTSTIVSIAFAVYSGVLASSNPITSNVVASSGSGAVASLTTPSLTYTAGQLIVIGGSAVGSPANNLTTTWSNSGTNTQLDHLVTNGNQIVTIDQGSTASGTSTTATQTLAPADTERIRSILVALNHA